VLVDFLDELFDFHPGGRGNFFHDDFTQGL
jgi:hypothetical protein